jgi:flavin reductase (DIM6/NTAB) family NADH-FMN oxidoreductase RutF
MFIDMQTGPKPWRDIYRLCIGFINPRPIALVSSISSAGALNLAPFSFYNMVCGNPPIVLFCPTVRRTGGSKDTLANVQATGEFVIATVTADIAAPMNRCAAELPTGESEFAFSGLTPKPAMRVRPPLVAESPVNMECRLRQVVSFGDGPGSGNVVFGDVLALHIDERILGPDGVVDPHKLSTVGRLGGAWYCNVTAPYEMQIPELRPEPRAAPGT